MLAPRDRGHQRPDRKAWRLVPAQGGARGSRHALFPPCKGGARGVNSRSASRGITNSPPNPPLQGGSRTGKSAIPCLSRADRLRPVPGHDARRAEWTCQVSSTPPSRTEPARSRRFQTAGLSSPLRSRADRDPPGFEASTIWLLGKRPLQAVGDRVRVRARPSARPRSGPRRASAGRRRRGRKGRGPGSSRAASGTSNTPRTGRGARPSGPAPASDRVEVAVREDAAVERRPPVPGRGRPASSAPPTPGRAPRSGTAPRACRSSPVRRRAARGLRRAPGPRCR